MLKENINNCIVSSRNDGIGARLLSLVNAIYIAKNTHKEFYFVWNTIDKDFEQKYLQPKDNDDLKGRTIDNEQYVFAKKFIVNHSLTGKIKSYPGVTPSIRYAQKTHLNYYVNHKNGNDFSIQDYNKYWNYIEFHPNIVETFQKISSRVQQLGVYSAIHIRSGDVVYSEYGKRYGDCFKATPVEFACEILRKIENGTVIVFSDDDKVVEYLKNIRNNIISFQDVLKDIKLNIPLSDTVQALCELHCMSMACKIYCGRSSFSILASKINNRKKIHYDLFFSFDKQYDIIVNNLNMITREQSAFSCYYAYRVGIGRVDDARLENLLEKALFYDYNILYIYSLIALYSNNRDYEKIYKLVEKYFKELLLNIDIFRNKDLHYIINKIFLLNSKNLWNFDKFVILLLELTKYCFINKIFVSAKTRIQNQLSYKLGQAMIVHSKSLLGYLMMPIVLLSIIISHKQEQKIYQEKIKKDPSLKLPPLEDYPDYQEALKLKNHLSYKLGQALIKANKTWYKGGYVKMWFEVRKLKQKIKKENDGN
ncbi:O-fucosyltransferase family protein [Campylobacter lari]|uniref:Sugar transferase n=1 Tax=Campylobacter lari NCTC 11845 TaxID=1388749 RepID=A0A0A8HWR2_CAMLA|nr:hypothetical protein [Campylobacter lari]AJD01205.1 hypothetical protein UPTC3659_0321 [Campylobacter lari NCTC 11845]